MLKEPVWLVRLVEWYSKETEEFIGEFVLPSIDLTQLQQRWNISSNDPMVELFRIDSGQAHFLRERTGFEFDLAQYDYFLTAATTDWAATQQEGGFMGLYPAPRELPGFPDAKRVMPHSVQPKADLTEPI